VVKDFVYRSGCGDSRAGAISSGSNRRVSRSIFEASRTIYGRESARRGKVKRADVRGSAWRRPGRSQRRRT